MNLRNLEINRFLMCHIHNYLKIEHLWVANFRHQSLNQLLISQISFRCNNEDIWYSRDISGDPKVCSEWNFWTFWTFWIFWFFENFGIFVILENFWFFDIFEFFEIFDIFQNFEIFEVIEIFEVSEISKMLRNAKAKHY